MNNISTALDPDARIRSVQYPARPRMLLCRRYSPSRVPFRLSLSIIGGLVRSESNFAVTAAQA